jgi:hypothetical protein
VRYLVFLSVAVDQHAIAFLHVVLEVSVISTYRKKFCQNFSVSLLSCAVRTVLYRQYLLVPVGVCKHTLAVHFTLAPQTII